MAKKIYLTPGPSALYFTVEEHLKAALKAQVPEISHRSSAYKAIHQEAVDNLRELLQLPTDFHIGFVASATEIWERLIQNLVENESLHLVNGSFSKRFYEIAKELGRQPTTVMANEGEITLAKEIPTGTTELVAITQNETSTGVSYPLAEVSLLRRNFPRAIIAMDVVSAIPALPINFNDVDSVYFSVQKCFGLPAGLGVWIYNDRCLQKAEQLAAKGLSIGSYHTLLKIHETGQKYQTPETPNVLNLFLLAKVSGDMLKKGIDQIRRETDYKAAVLYHLFDSHPLLSPFVKPEEIRSKTVAVAEVQGGSERLISALAVKGLVIGSGYGKFKDDHIRIANFPTHSKEQIELLADLIEKYR